MPQTKDTQSRLNQSALKKENLRLQRQIAALEAKLISAQNALRARPPYAGEPAEPVTVEQVRESFRAMQARIRKPPADGGAG